MNEQCELDWEGVCWNTGDKLILKENWRQIAEEMNFYYNEFLLLDLMFRENDELYEDVNYMWKPLPSRDREKEYFTLFFMEREKEIHMRCDSTGVTFRETPLDLFQQVDYMDVI